VNRTWEVSNVFTKIPSGSRTSTSRAFLSRTGCVRLVRLDAAHAGVGR
jgi:hypothetical protein